MHTHHSHTAFSRLRSQGSKRLPAHCCPCWFPVSEGTVQGRMPRSGSTWICRARSMACSPASRWLAGQTACSLPSCRWCPDPALILHCLPVLQPSDAATAPDAAAHARQQSQAGTTLLSQVLTDFPEQVRLHGYREWTDLSRVLPMMRREAAGQASAPPGAKDQVGIVFSGFFSPLLISQGTGLDPTPSLLISQLCWYTLHH